MSVADAQMLVLMLGLYFGIGFIFACLFISLGVQRIDPAARTMPVRARLLILPGAMLLWPFMAFKWLTQTEPPLT